MHINKRTYTYNKQTR